jgi:hypothetical protein
MSCAFGQGELAQLLDAINETGYGLTHGVQTRIDETVEAVCARIRAGNIYVNRNIVGAVVGVQPFGGDRLSGTGPKAGGPHLSPPARQRSAIAASPRCECRGVAARPNRGNQHAVLRPRGRVACVADTERALVEQVRVAAATGNIALLPASAANERVRDAAGGACELVADPLAAEPDAVLFAGEASAAQELRQAPGGASRTDRSADRCGRQRLRLDAPGQRTHDHHQHDRFGRQRVVAVFDRNAGLMHFIDAATIRARLPWPRMLAALDEALRSEVYAPLRVNHAVDVPGSPAASLLLMPAWRTGRHVGVKLVTVFPATPLAASDRCRLSMCCSTRRTACRWQRWTARNSRRAGPRGHPLTPRAGCPGATRIAS